MIGLRGRLLALGLLASSCLPGGAQALVCNWQGGSYGYRDNIRWDCGSIPTGSDEVRIGSGMVTAAGFFVPPVYVIPDTWQIGSVSVATGARLNLGLGSTVVVPSVHNDGMIRIGALGAVFTGVDAGMSVTGTGTIEMNLGKAFTVGTTTIGREQTIRGDGTLLDGTGLMINHGLIEADDASNALVIDMKNLTGLSGQGVGTGGSAGLYSDGVIRANGATLRLNAARYEIGSGGSLEAIDGTVIGSGSAANIVNQQLVGGSYLVRGTGSMTLSQFNLIATLGDDTTRTTITLDGVNTDFYAGRYAGSPIYYPILTLDSTLSRIAAAGVLNLLGGRSLDNKLAFTIEGALTLGGGTFKTGSLVNSGAIAGFGTIKPAITNTGSITAEGGTLSVFQITSGGTVTVASGGRLDLATEAPAAASTIGTLTLNGALALAAASVTVLKDYVNAGFGSGVGFNAMAGVASAGGAINAASATQDLSAAGLIGATLDLGATRFGTTVDRILTVTNNGTQTTLRGSVGQAGTGVSIALPDFVAAANGGTADIALRFGAVAGTVASTLTVANNFGNVADSQILATGRVYTTAVASGITPDPIGFYARTTQSGTADVILGNTASGALVDTLIASVAGGGMVSANPLSLTGGKSGAWGLTFAGTTAGSYTGTIQVALVSHNDEMADLSLGTRSIAYTGTVYTTAAATISASSVTLAATRVGTTSSAAVTIGNANGGAAFADTLATTVSNTGGARVAGPGVIAAGGSGALIVSLGDTAGRQAGTVTLGMNSRNANMADLSLGSRTIAYTGNVYAAAAASAITPNPVAFYARTNQAGTTSVILGNTTTGALVDSLVASVTGGGMVSANTLSLAGGRFGAWALNFGGTTAGSYAGTIQVALASHNDEMADLSLGARSIAYTGKIYATAAPTIAATSVTLATRVGGTASASVSVANNNGGGSFADALVTTASSTGLATVAGPGTIAGGKSGVVALSLGGASGRYTGSVTLTLVSRNGDMADLSLGSRKINYTGNVYTAAAAGALTPSVVDFGAIRTGQTASRSVTLANVASGALVDSLVATVGGAGPVSGASGAIAAGQSGIVSLKFGGAAGRYDALATLGLASHNADMDDLSLGTKTVAYMGKIYAVAAPTIDTGKASFIARQGSVSVAASILVSNGASGALADTLLTTVRGVSGGFAAGNLGALAAGQSGTLGLNFADTGIAGVKTGSATIGFASRNPDMADLALGQQTVVLSGVVTEIASARIVSLGGIGTLTGGGTSYMLDLGRFAAGGAGGTFSLGVLNDILSSAYGETLGGGFDFSADQGLSFSGADFSGLAGGMTNGSGRLSFAVDGLGQGDYSGTLYVNLFSRYDGLEDMVLERVRLDVRATVFVATPAAVPEPSTWLQMIAGFGVAGTVIRRRGRSSAKAS